MSSDDPSPPLNQSSTSVLRGENLLALTNVTDIPDMQVAISMAAESPVNFECKLIQVLQQEDAAAAKLEQWIVLKSHHSRVSFVASRQLTYLY